MDKFDINIGLFGCVSVGKSTFLNAIAGKQYSDAEIKKTTMVPQVYVQAKFIDNHYRLVHQFGHINVSSNQIELCTIFAKYIDQSHFF